MHDQACSPEPLGATTARRPGDAPRVQAERRAQQKYRQIDGGIWVLNTDVYGVRPVDLVSRNPDRLREFTTKGEAVRFELECYDNKQNSGGARYQTIPKKSLDIPKEQLALDASLKQALVESTEQLSAQANREADALHARHDETLGKLEAALAILQGKTPAREEGQTDLERVNQVKGVIARLQAEKKQLEDRINAKKVHEAKEAQDRTRATTNPFLLRE